MCAGSSPPQPGHCSQGARGRRGEGQGTVQEATGTPHCLSCAQHKVTQEALGHSAESGPACLRSSAHLQLTRREPLPLPGPDPSPVGQRVWTSRECLKHGFLWSWVLNHVTWRAWWQHRFPGTPSSGDDWEINAVALAPLGQPASAVRPYTHPPRAGCSGHGRRAGADRTKMGPPSPGASSSLPSLPPTGVPRRRHLRVTFRS